MIWVTGLVQGHGHGQVHFERLVSTTALVAAGWLLPPESMIESISNGTLVRENGSAIIP